MSKVDELDTADQWLGRAQIGDVDVENVTSRMAIY